MANGRVVVRDTSVQGHDGYLTDARMNYQRMHSFYHVEGVSVFKTRAVTLDIITQHRGSSCKCL